MSDASALLTIGHSTHAPDEFVELLRRNGVELLADVRRHPGSRRVPWTASDELERHLAAAGIAYLHLVELGGRRRPRDGSPNGAWRVAQFQGYADHMETDEFQAALGRLEREALARRTAIMCAEAQWWRCHRRLVADALVVRGWEVLHVDTRGGTKAHELTEFAVARGDRVRYPAPGRC